MILFIMWDTAAAYIVYRVLCSILSYIFKSVLDITEYIEGSVHKGSISIYFRFWDFYTMRQISTSPTSLWCQFF